MNQTVKLPLLYTPVSIDLVAQLQRLRLIEQSAVVGQVQSGGDRPNRIK